ncbi:MAG: S46 family peptidase [Planctomycetia bacterium]|nr:S46 family peptidase [Planctomycetia bacterium]
MIRTDSASKLKTIQIQASATRRPTLPALYIIALTITCFWFTSNFATADEGMWLFNSPPKQQLKERYNYELTDDFLDLLQKSSVRFSNGGSGSFVSPQGLVMTNHHVALSLVEKLSTTERDLVKSGYYAARQEEELKCRDIELVMLDHIVNVTSQVNAAVTSEMTFEQAQNARRSVMSRLEKEAADASGLKCEVVTLFQGGQYHLYCYKAFKDVRLVFAPEVAVGFFGGDPDNFEYPRYNLDVSFFRVYENGEPYHPDRYLKWSERGAADGELVFVSGHPGRTNRFDTPEHLLFQRDVYYPYYMNKLRRNEILLADYSETGSEFARAVSSELFRLRNSRKNRTGILAGLQSPAVFEKISSDWQQFTSTAVEKKLLDADAEGPETTIYNALVRWNEIFLIHELFENQAAFDSRLFKIARGIVRCVTESGKPNESRLREYRETELASTKEKILSPAVIDKRLELLRLTDSLNLYLELTQGAEYDDDESGEEGYGVLGGFSPGERAAQLLAGTQLDKLDVRTRHLNMSLEELEESDDLMIQFALGVDPVARDVRALYETEVAEPMRQAYAELAKTRMRLDPRRTYPDATFTLRLSYGKVAGYTSASGESIPAWTTISGAYQHARDHRLEPPYDLPERWFDNEEQVNGEVPLNLVTTNDIIGGNSGSPLVNGKGEIVGLIFDGNLESLSGNFVYTEQRARAVSVHSSGIIEIINRIYDARRVVEEIDQARN